MGFIWSLVLVLIALLSYEYYLEKNPDFSIRKKVKAVYDYIKNKVTK